MESPKILKLLKSTEPPAWDDLRQEVEQKVGRNVLLFQRLEGILKFLSAHGSVSGYLREIAEKHEQQIASTERKMMGQLVGLFEETVLADSEASSREPEDLKGIWISRDLKLQSGDSDQEALKAELAGAVSERNELIHHFFSRFDIYSLEGAHAAIQYLDRQHERILQILATLQWLTTALHDNLETYAAFLESEAGRKYLELWYFRGRQVMLLLGDFACEKARPDGWAILDAAAQFVEREVPGELAAVKAHFGQRTLKRFLLFTEWFEVSEEPTPKGGVRMLYRKISTKTWQIRLS